jgi:hypothetical protein
VTWTEDDAFDDSTATAIAVGPKRASMGSRQGLQARLPHALTGCGSTVSQVSQDTGTQSGQEGSAVHHPADAGASSGGHGSHWQRICGLGCDVIRGCPHPAGASACLGHLEETRISCSSTIVITRGGRRRAPNCISDGRAVPSLPVRNAHPNAERDLRLRGFRGQCRKLRLAMHRRAAYAEAHTVLQLMTPQACPAGRCPRIARLQPVRCHPSACRVYLATPRINRPGRRRR